MTGSQATATTGSESPPPGDRAVALPALSLLAIVVGLVAGFGAVFFRMMIALVHNLSLFGQFSFTYDANHFDPPSPLGPWIILVPVIGGQVVVFLVEKFAPEAKGHGVPEVMYAVYHRDGNVRGRVSVIKSLASALSIGTGASVGREGPIIQIGASFGSTLGRLLALTRWQKVTLLAAGAGAGIAATFNTPIGGVLFAVELLLPEISNRTFLPVVLATTSAMWVSRQFLGTDPAFAIPANFMMAHGDGFYQLLAFAVLGVLAGILSWAFITLLAKAEDGFEKLPGNAYTANALGMLVVGLGAYAFQLATGHQQVTGVGYATIQAILEGQPQMVLLGVALALLAGKLLATTISLGSGASGGVFSPSLFMGAALGVALSAAIKLVFPEAPISPVACAVVGMGAVVGGATGASMTAIVMIFEMTRDYSIIVPIVLAVALAVGVRRMLVEANIYTIKLRQRGTPIPSDRHTNMYLVQPARDVMSRDFVTLPGDMPLAQAVADAGEAGAGYIVVSDGDRIDGFVRLGDLRVEHSPPGATLGSLAAGDFVIAPANANLNRIITRMNRRTRSLALVTEAARTVPHASDVAGVIDAPQIAAAVIRNHYG